MNELILFECGICDCYHPWEFTGDCRDDDNRTFPDDYAIKMGVSEGDIVVRSMDDRIAAD